MIITLHGAMSLRLLRLLTTRNDLNTLPLRVSQRVATEGQLVLEITRADGSDLSDTETAHVRGLTAAHAVEPL